MNPLLPLMLRRVAPALWRIESLPTELATQLRDVDWRVGELRLTALATKEQVLTAMGQAGDFPDHYGRNWDAAYDCLTDLSLDLLCVRAADGLADDVGETLLSIVEDALDFWHTQGRRTYVLWEGSIDRPALP